MISKELLSEVLGNKVESIILVEKYDGRIGGRVNDLHITFEDYVENINIYEIVHRCKEWAYSLGFNLTSQYQYAYKVSTVVPKAYVFIDNRKFTSREIITAPSEVEAIFKACQWILNNKENNDKTHTN